MVDRKKTTSPALKVWIPQLCCLGLMATAKPETYVAVTAAMLGAAMFGFDQGNFGNVQSFESFRQEWCLGRVQHGVAIPGRSWNQVLTRNLWRL